MEHRPAAGGSVSLAKQHGSGGGTAAGTHRRHLGSMHLTACRLTPKLQDRLTYEAISVQSPRGQLPAMRVERQRAPKADSASVTDEIRGLAVAAEAQTLQPGQRIEREAVVQTSHVHVVGGEIRAGPQVLGRPL